MGLIGAIVAVAAFAPATASATSNFAGTYCTSSEFCLGVGLSDASESSQAYGKKWNGTSWSELTIPHPSGALESRLTGVSCRSNSDCVAVGSSVDELNKRSPFAVKWNGTSWSELPTPPSPGGSTEAELLSVACPPSSSGCEAVGAYVGESGSRHVLGIWWDGTEWNSETIPTPEGATASELTGVMCKFEYSCQAVGSYVDASGKTKSLGVYWDGATWTIKSTPIPSGATYSALSAVNCNSWFCAAVGAYVTEAGVKKTYGLNYNGESWALVTTPSPSATSNELSGVSCTATNACIATGSYEKNSDTLPLAIKWNGTAWTEQVVETETLGALSAKFLALSCSSASACQGAGSIVYGHAATSRSLAYRYDGSKWILTESGGYQRTWALVDLPKSAVAGAAEQNDVACPSSTSCIRVGTLVNEEVESSRAKSWNGTSWSLMTTPSPSGAQSSRLLGVACPSTTSCRAVGSYVDSSGVTKTLSLAWNGTSWSVTTTPNPSGAQSSQLAGIACTSTSDCRAVGSYVDSSGVTKTLAESWNGTSWSVTTTPNPAAATSSQLAGISCTSTSNCRAVGSFIEEHVTKTLILSWNGSSWSVVSSPNPSGAKLSSLADVYCSSTTACMAAGTFINSEGKQEGLVEHLSGSTWSVFGASWLKGWSTAFRSVWCTSSEACKVVGTYAETETKQHSVVAIWKNFGDMWEAQSAFDPPGATRTGLAGLACTSATNCMAVGTTLFEDQQAEELAFNFNGTNWVRNDPPATFTPLAGISCGSGSSCIAVGKSTVGSTTEARIWKMDGEGGWTNLATPAVSQGNLLDVSCTDDTHCTAVGSQAISQLTLAERWNGTEWATQTTANPSGGSSVILTSVECPTTTYCMSVGRYATGTNPINPLSESWNGTSWTIQTVPVPSGSSEQWFEDVTCTATNNCEAVGLYKDSGGTKHSLAEVWDGSKWQIQTVPDPVGATRTNLIGVSCTTSKACTAVGSAVVGSGTQTLVVRWNGTSWSIQASPNSEGSAVDILTNVSCVTSVKCVAVGLVENVSGTSRTPLVLGWDGTTWSVETAPAPSSSLYSQLEGISCRKAADCYAVGSATVSGRSWEMVTKSLETKEEGGQATVLEGGGEPPSLTQPQEESAEALIEEAPGVQAALGSSEYELLVGPWTEETKEGAEVLIGAVGLLELNATKSWSEYWSWPSIEYPFGEYGTYGSEALPAKASKIETMQVNLDAETDKEGNFIGGQVVQLAPTPVAGDEGEVTVSPSVKEETNSEVEGY